MAAPKKTYGLKSRIRPDLSIDTVTISFSPDYEPTIKIAGTLKTKNRLAAGTTAVVTTRYIGPEGRAFIEELKAAFAAEQQE